MSRKILLVLTVCFLFTTVGNAQFRHKSLHGAYYPVKDAQVKKKLEQWQDIKFGLMMHWGTYSQWGVVESWSLCPEDEGWCVRRDKDYFRYKKDYENLQTTFNPVDFNPDKWAKVAKDAGMRYVVFTTKHHDGFCMFDTKLTDYKITSEKTPYHTNKRANITKEIFKAFRAQDFMIGAYFSKPDWNVPSYWWPNFPPRDRNVNYDVKKYPQKWEEFVQFTHGQIDELMSDYGKIDILWFDGGWVCKMTPEEVMSYKMKPGNKQPSLQNQDIRMDEIARNARKKQPGLIVVDRAVEGPNQNYMTPENKVPDSYVPVPWESNIISGGGYSYVPGAKYKSSHNVIQMLVDIVAKGGNLVLNIAPSPKGDFDPAAYDMLKGVARWMKVNSEAIYDTRPVAPYREGNMAYTRNRFTGAVYATYLTDDAKDKLPSAVMLDNVSPANNATVKILGHNQKLEWRSVGKGCIVEMPQKLIKSLKGSSGYVFKVSATK